MTNMFKKSLVAIALAGVSTGAMAAQLSASPLNVAEEWAQSVQVGPTNNPLGGATVVADPLEITMNAAYTQNDTITLTFTGNSLIGGTLPNSFQFTGGAGGTGNGTATMGLISTTVNDAGNTIVSYRVTEVSGDTSGATGTLSDLEFMPRRVTSGVTVSFAAATATGEALDTSGGAARTAGLIRLGNQFNAIGLTNNSNANLLSQTIDVARSRLQFVNFTGASSQANGNFDIRPSVYGDPAVTFTPSPGYGVTNEGVEYTLSGNFAWLLDEDGEADEDYDFFSASNCGTGFEISADYIVVECAAGTSFNPQFLVEAANDRTIPVQSFGLTAEVTYDAAGQAGTSELSRSAGAWGLNGSTVQVSYMPYSASISQVINVTNRSNQTGDVSVVAIGEDGSRHNLGVIAQSPAGSMTRIAGQIQSALSEAVGTDLSEVSSTQRYALQIITNAPANGVEIYTAYNVGQTGARLVVNDSNGGGRSK